MRQWRRSRRETRVWGTGTVDNAYAPVIDPAAPPAISPALLEVYKRRRRAMKQSPSRSSRHRSQSFSRNSVDERAWIDLTDGEDVHMRLMRRYKEAPAKWYLTTFGMMLLVGFFVVE